MTFHIQLSYGERCPKNGAQLKKTPFIDKRKLPENFWLNLLQEKCPEGLGDVSESLQNDQNLEPEDFEVVHENSPVSLCSQDAEPCRVLSHPKPGTCRQLETPSSTRYHDEQRCETPSLFSQEESINVTPSRGKWLRDGRSPIKSACCGKLGSECKQTAYGSSCSLLPVYSPVGALAHASREHWTRKTTCTPELLAEIKAPESASLSGLLAASDDEIIEEWSESMATPPLIIQRDLAAEEADSKENLNEEAMNKEEQPPSKRIVRVLFSDGVCDCSEENASLSLENRTIETDADTIDQTDLQVTVERPNGSPEGLLLESSLQNSENTRASNISVEADLNASFSHESSKPAEATIGGGRPGTPVTTPVARACDTDPTLKPSLLASSPWPRSILSPSAHFHALAQSTPKPLIDDKWRNAAVSIGFTDVPTSESTSDLATDPARDRSVPFESPSPSCKEALFHAAQDVSRIHEEASCKLEASALTFVSPSKSFELAMAREADKLCSKVDGDSKTSELGSSLSANTSDVLSQAFPPSSAKSRPTFETDGTMEVNEAVPDVAAGAESDQERKCSLEEPSPGLPEDCGILRRRSFCKVPGLRRSVRPKRFSYPTARQVSQKHTNTCTRYRTRMGVDGPRNGLRGACEDTSSENRAEKAIVETLASHGPKVTVGSEVENEGGIPAAKKLRTEEGRAEAVTQTNVVKCDAKNLVTSADYYGNKESEKINIMSTLPADTAAASWQCSPGRRTASKMVTRTSTEGMTQKSSMSCTAVKPEIEVCSSVAQGTLAAVSKSFDTMNVPKGEELLFDMDALSQFPVESLSLPSPSKFATGDSLPVLSKADKRAKEDLCKSRCPVENLSCSYHEGCAEIATHKEAEKESELIACNEDSDMPLTLSFDKYPSGICINVPPSSRSEYRVVPEFRGFQTASGKDMEVLSEALTKAKCTMKQIDRSLGLQGVHTDTSEVSSGTGEAYRCSQDNVPCTLPPNGILTVFCASNVGDKKSPVRPYVKDVLKGYGVSCDYKEQQKAQPFFSGFSTASGKRVHPSDSALKKAKITLSKIDAELQETHGIQKERDGCPRNEPIIKDLVRQVPKPNGRKVSDFPNRSGESKLLDEVEGVLAYDMPDNDMCKLMELCVPPLEESFQDLYETANRESFGPLQLPVRNTAVNIQTTDSESPKIANDSLLEELLSDCGRKKLASIGRLKENGFLDACCQHGSSDSRTASGQDVETSREALQKGAAIMRQLDRSLDNNEKSSDPNSRGSIGFSGFRTASGQDVEMSKEALEKGAAIMKQLDRLLDNNGKSSDPNSRRSIGFSGFRTASGQDVEMSKEALEKGAAIMRQLDRSLDNNEKSSEPNSRRSIGFSGFRTASGQDVETSREALEKGAAIMRQLDRSLDNKEKSSDPNSRRSIGFSGFRTASGQDVEMSKEALEKGAAVMRQLDRSLDNNGKSSDPNSRRSIGFSGFRTASGQDVEMSKEALEKGAAIMRQLDRSLDNNGKSSDPNSRRSIGFSGFRTASGQDVEMSKEALEKGAAIMRQLDRSLDNNGKSSDPNSRGSIGFSGFRTASGQDVEMSKEALEKGAAIMRQLDRSLDNNGKSSDPNSRGSIGFSGFRTASGQDVEMSKEALEKGAAIMRQLDRSLDNNGKSSDPNSRGSIGFSGFRTASGQDVEMSKEALEKGAAIMRQLDRSLDNNGKSSDPNSRRSIGFSGFRTASGQDVEMSKEALEKGAAIMRQLDRSLDNNGKSSDPNSRGSIGFSGFRTASGQDVEMSKEALEKGAAIMRQLDRSLDNNGKSSDPNSRGSIGFSGFRTASGQDVETSREALEKGAAIIMQMDRSLDNNEKSRDPNSSGSYGFCGFRTASDQDIRVQMSKGALKTGANIMGQIGRSLNNNGELCSRDCDVPSILSGFKTACGKNVKLPAEAFEEGVAFMEHIDQSLASIGDVRQLCESGAGSFSGFQTAGGRKMKISNSARAKAKLMMSSINDELVFPSSKIEHVDPSTTKSVIEELPKGAEKIVSCGSEEGLGTSGFSGFQTAGGKKFEVSEEGMAKARPFFGESDVKHTENGSVVLQSGLTETDEGRKTRSTVQTPVPELNGQRRVTPMLAEPLFGDCDDEVSREILESSNALMADDSFIGVSEYQQDTTESLPLAVTSINRTRTYASTVEPSEQGSEDTGAPLLRYRIPRRHSAPLLCSADMFQQRTMQTRTGLHPLRTTPSGALHDRRVRFRIPFQARLTSANRDEGEISLRTFGGMEALKPLQTATPGCFINNRKHPPPSTLNSNKTRSTSSCLRPQFITPYRSQTQSKEMSPLARCSTSGSSVRGSEVEGPEEGEPSTKKLRISEISKMSCSVKPQLGFLSRLRRRGPRMKLKEYVGNGSPEHHSTEELLELGVSKEVLSVTAPTASFFRFNGRTFFSASVLPSNKGVRTEDGGILYVGQDGNVGLDEIQSAFLSTPGVDSQLINELWVANHYRWIVWKLAAMEVAFPLQFAGRRLTPESVLCQLKYRYDREVDHSERSALKKIMERDDVSTRTMVLCVAGVSVGGAHPQDPSKKDEQDKEKHEHNFTQTSDTQKRIQVTDGWYAIPVILDRPLTRLLNDGIIFVGQKLCTYGAELVGSEQATTPLEAPPSLMLRLHANSTRRARWDTKLGFHCHTRAFPLSIASLFGDGGLTGCVDVIVLRQYPIQWMEKLPDGTNVFRNSRLEERESKTFEQDRLQRREKLFVKVQEEFEQEFRQLGVEKRRSNLVRRRSMSSRDLKELHDGKEIYEALSQATDPDAAKACLDERQLRVLEEYTRSLHDKRRAELQRRFEQVWTEQEGKHQCHRNVVPLLKVRIADYRSNTPLPATEERRHAVLSIWRPSEEVMYLLTEGTRLRMYNLTAVGTRYKQSTPELQLSATRTTRYKTMPSDPDVTSQVYSPRQACSFEQLRSGSLQPYTEVDLVGLVVFYSPVSSFSSSSIQTIFIADEESNLVALKFWGGLKAFAVEELVKPRSFICCSNLVIRPDKRLPCPSLCFSELSSLAHRPRVPHLRTALDSLQSKIQHMDTFMTQIQKKLDVILRPNRSSPSAEVKVTTVRMYSSSPESARSDSCGTEFPGPSSTETILDLSTTFNKAANTPAADGNQVTLYESRCTLAGPSGSAASAVGLGAKSRISKRKLLDSYPEPPPLSPLVSPIPASVRREFKRPRRIGSVSAEHNEQ